MNIFLFGLFVQRENIHHDARIAMPERSGIHRNTSHRSTQDANLSYRYGAGRCLEMIEDGRGNVTIHRINEHRAKGRNWMVPFLFRLIDFRITHRLEHICQGSG